MLSSSNVLALRHREIFELPISVEERLSYVGESLRDSLNSKSRRDAALARSG